MEGSLFDRLVQFDRTRKSFPGEHWFALATGLWFLRRKGGSVPSTLLSKAIGAAFIVRAASGRDGLQKLLKDSSGAGSAGRPWTAREREEALPAPSASAPRAALLQAPEMAGRDASVERASQARAGGFPDFR